MISFVALNILFWSCLGLVAYAYLAYPALVWMLAWRFGRRHRAPTAGGDCTLPSVSLLIAAHNEESVIESRLRNAMELDYPRENLEIVVGSDGSTDRSAELVSRFASQGVRLLEFRQNRGKASVLNDAIPTLRGEVVVLSDANTLNDPQAVRRLVRWLDDPSTAAVCGKLVLTDPATGRNVDSLYWKYETFLKTCESRLGAVLGANGGIYAIRKADFRPIPPETIVDDFVIPLQIRLRTGGRIFYDREALAFEETPPNVRDEFRRRSRIGAGGYQAIGLLRGLARPRHGWAAFAFVSHKILRWLGPFLLLGALGANLALVVGSGRSWLTEATLMAQLGLLVMALLGSWLPGRSAWVKPFRLATMFVSMNAALFVGFLRWAGGIRTGTWARTTRLVPAEGPSR